jgi:anti-anti-sigma factor
MTAATQTIGHRPESRADGRFRCPVARDGATLVLTPRGDIDIAALPVLAAAQRGLAIPGLRSVRLEMGQVPFMDSAALHLLGELRHRCRVRGLDLRVTGLRPQHHRLLAVADRAGVVPAAA